MAGRMGAVGAKPAAASGGGPGPGVFDPSIITWHSYYWAEDPSWTNPGDGAGVSSWRDASGNSRTLTQATSGKQPLFRSTAAALNGRSAIDFDGIDDFLESSSFTALTTTNFSLVLIAKVDTIVDNTYVASDTVRGVFMTSPGNAWSAYFGTAFNSAATVDTSAVLLSFFGNDATAVFQKNGTDTTAGNVGNGSWTQNHLGSYDSSGNFADLQIAFFGVYSSGDVRSNPSWGTFKANAGTDYGITVA